MNLCEFISYFRFKSDTLNYAAMLVIWPNCTHDKNPTTTFETFAILFDGKLQQFRGNIKTCENFKYLLVRNDYLNSNNKICNIFIACELWLKRVGAFCVVLNQTFQIVLCCFAYW